MMFKLLLVLLLSVCMKSVSASYSCCTPDQWSGYSIEVNENSGPEVFAQKNYHYSYTTLSIRIDTIYLDGSVNQTTYSNYKDLTTTGTEWVMNNIDGTCYQTGPDFWNSICFGDNYGIPFLAQNSSSILFGNPTNGISVLTDRYCRPLSISNSYSGIISTFYGLSNVIDTSVFDLPSACH